MIKVLIVDDDESVRNFAMRCLARSDVQLASAANGKLALEQAKMLNPDVVICDIDMPGIDGFQVLEALKTDETLGETLVMMLTSQTSRDAQRLGMTLGADDFLTKPFTEEELVSAFDGLLKKRGRLQAVVGAAVKGQEEYLRRIFANRLDGGSVVDGYGPDSRFEDLSTPSQILLHATVLFSDIRSFTSIAEKLTASEVADLLTKYFERAWEPVIANGGIHLKMMGDGLMAVFTDEPDRARGEAYEWPAARRALAAAISMSELSKEFAHWVAGAFPNRGLPPFQTGFGIHCGEVAISQMGSATNKVATPIGDTVNIAARLESSTKDLGWEIVASKVAVELAGEGVIVGAKTSLGVRGKSAPIDVVEVKSLNDMPDEAERTLRVARTEMRENFEANAQMAARAVKGALGKKLASFRSPQGEVTGSQLSLAGYRIVRRIGEGGMSSIYLATRESKGDLVVLKVLDAGGGAPDQMARFMREYSLLSTIRHPNIVRIYNQGFSDEHAYIAMEYFENGDLRSRMKQAMDPAVVVDVTIQVARALSVIHALDIVHRDLKPENLMVRADGSVVLADFGIAKMVGDDIPESTLTQAGELIGSPSYMSPEQVAGKMITHLSDLYSLGVMFYEMLAGERPFKAATLMSILSQQANAPPPKLPRGLEKFQPIVDRLMAKQPLRRYASAEALLADLAGFPSVHTLL